MLNGNPSFWTIRYVPTVRMSFYTKCERGSIVDCQDMEMNVSNGDSSLLYRPTKNLLLCVKSEVNLCSNTGWLAMNRALFRAYVSLSLVAFYIMVNCTRLDRADIPIRSSSHVNY